MTGENKRLVDIIKFYSILDELENRIKNKLTLCNSSKKNIYAKRGIYFFFELGQIRHESGTGLRVVHIGTHALITKSKTTLWDRLSQHKGSIKSGGGNHRGSIFRLLVGNAIINNQNLNYPTWGIGSSASRKIRENEIIVERLVSETIGKMPFLYLSIDDEASQNSLRGYIKINSVSLLSNYNKPPIDPATKNWLGYKCNREKVYSSGLWNQDYVDENYDENFLYILEELVYKMKG